MFFCFFFHNLEPRNAGLVDVKRYLHQKKIKRDFCARKSKKASPLKMLFGLKKHKCIMQSVLVIIFTSFFTCNQAEQIKKGIICVRILLEIHLTEHGRFHFQGQTTFYTPVLVTPRSQNVEHAT